jgi:hypothetical protein
MSASNVALAEGQQAFHGVAVLVVVVGYHVLVVA